MTLYFSSKSIQRSKFQSDKHKLILKNCFTQVNALTYYKQDLVINFVQDLTSVFQKVKKTIVINAFTVFPWNILVLAEATIGVEVSVRSCQKLLPYPVESMTAGSKTDPPLAKAVPINNSGRISGIMY